MAGKIQTPDERARPASDPEWIAHICMAALYEILAFENEGGIVIPAHRVQDILSSMRDRQCWLYIQPDPDTQQYTLEAMQRPPEEQS